MVVRILEVTKYINDENWYVQTEKYQRVIPERWVHAIIKCIKENYGWWFAPYDDVVYDLRVSERPEREQRPGGPYQ